MRRLAKNEHYTLVVFTEEGQKLSEASDKKKGFNWGENRYLVSNFFILIYVEVEIIASYLGCTGFGCQKAI